VADVNEHVRGRPTRRVLVDGEHQADRAILGQPLLYRTKISADRVANLREVWDLGTPEDANVGIQLQRQGRYRLVVGLCESTHGESFKECLALDISDKFLLCRFVNHAGKINAFLQQ